MTVISPSMTCGETMTRTQIKMEKTKSRGQDRGQNQDPNRGQGARNDLGARVPLAVRRDLGAEVGRGSQGSGLSQGHQAQAPPLPAGQDHGAKTRRKDPENPDLPPGRSDPESLVPRPRQAPRIPDPAPRLGTGQGSEGDRPNHEQTCRSHVHQTLVQHLPTIHVHQHPVNNNLVHCPVE